MLSLIQALTRYIDYCRLEEQSPRTIEGKQSNLRLFVSWYITNYDFDIADLNKDGINDYIAYLHDYRDPQTKKAITKATRRNKITAVRMFCRYLFEEDYLDVNFADKVRTPKADKSITQSILQPDEVSAIAKQTMLHGSFGVRDCAILAVFFSCGLRRNEITTLTLKNINYTNKLLFIKNGKGNKDRVVPIAKDALDLIEHYKNTIRPSQMTFESGDTLFLDNNGRPYRGGQISELIRKHKKRAGISKPGASNLYRHTTATTLLDNGADLLTVQKILGHASVSTTQVYTHIAVRKLSQDYQANHPSTLHPEVFIPAEHPIHQKRL
jgi:integrase/recombinase XerD